LGRTGTRCWPTWRGYVRHQNSPYYQQTTHKHWRYHCSNFLELHSKQKQYEKEKKTLAHPLDTNNNDDDFADDIDDDDLLLLLSPKTLSPKRMNERYDYMSLSHLLKISWLWLPTNQLQSPYDKYMIRYACFILLSCTFFVSRLPSLCRLSCVGMISLDYVSPGEDWSSSTALDTDHGGVLMTCHVVHQRHVCNLEKACCPALHCEGDALGGWAVTQIARSLRTKRLCKHDRQSSYCNSRSCQ
jgi:hypothetical protein